MSNHSVVNEGSRATDAADRAIKDAERSLRLLRDTLTENPSCDNLVRRAVAVSAMVHSALWAVSEVAMEGCAGSHGHTAAHRLWDTVLTRSTRG